jgi:hypothetical protein
VNASKITPKEDYIAWTTGITTGTLSSPFLLVFAPVAGYYAGRKYHRKTIEKKVQARLVGDGDIRSIIRRWNESTWAERGFSAWLQLPDDPKEVRADGTKSKKRRFRIIIVPTDQMGLPASPSSWNVNERSVVGTPIAEAIVDQHQTVKKLQSNPPENPPLPPPAFATNPSSKSAAFMTSPPHRANESTSGGSASEKTKPEEIKHVLPAGTEKQEMPSLREAAELPWTDSATGYDLFASCNGAILALCLKKEREGEVVPSSTEHLEEGALVLSILFEARTYEQFMDKKIPFRDYDALRLRGLNSSYLLFYFSPNSSRADEEGGWRHRDMEIAWCKAILECSKWSQIRTIVFKYIPCSFMKACMKCDFEHLVLREKSVGSFWVRGGARRLTSPPKETPKEI